MPEETVLLRIITLANMAGVKEARAGFLGMQPAILGAGIALAILVKIGKDSLDNTVAQEGAILNLTQAVAAYNSHLGRTIKAHDRYVAGTAATTRQTASLAVANDRVKIAIDSVRLAQEKYNLAIYWYGATHAKTLAAKIQLERATLRLAIAETRAGSAVGGTAGHYVHVGATIRKTAIDLEDYKRKVEAFIVVNQRYISNQYDVIKTAAEIVRAGHSEKESLRILSDSLDLAAINQEDVSITGLQLVKVLAGTSKVLKGLGITTAEYNAIMKKKESLTKKDAEILALIETRTKKGRQTTDELKQSQNQLNIAWQTFTTNIGPGVDKTLRAIIDDATELVGWLDLITQWVSKGGFSGLEKGFLDFLSGGRISKISNKGTGTKSAPVVGTAFSPVQITGPVTVVTHAQHAKIIKDAIRRSDRSQS